MATKEVATRAFLIVMALIFLVGTVGFTIAVLFDAKKNNQENNVVQEQNADTLAGKALENYQPVPKVDELSKIDFQTGTGAEAKPDSTVKVHYTGALATTGIIFESSKDTGEPASLGLDQVIPGWTLGVAGMKVGGKRRLVIPANLAYGEQGSPPAIPPNTPLVFDIELIAIE